MLKTIEFDQKIKCFIWGFTRARTLKSHYQDPLFFTVLFPLSDLIKRSEVTDSLQETVLHLLVPHHTCQGLHKIIELFGTVELYTSTCAEAVTNSRLEETPELTL